MSDRPIPAARRAARAADDPHSQFVLLRERRFAPFFWTQFLGAMNDNVFKIGFTSLVTYQSARFSGVDPKTAAFLISAIFILPFVLFSATSGQVADKYDKAMLARWIKTFEIAVMLTGAAGFALHSAPLLYACTFLMGVHSTVFGPVKYAYLPQNLSERELMGGNGLVEMGTFVAILIGTIAGGVLAGIGAEAGTAGGALWVGGICIGIAIAGRVASAFVPPCAPAQPGLRINWNPVSETWRNLRLARGNCTVFVGLIGISWLWFFGATFLASFFNFSKDVLHGDADVVTVLLAMFSLGIGIGSLLCDRLSGRRIEIGLVPLGSIGMSVFAIDLFFASHALPPSAHLLAPGEFLQAPVHWRILADLFLLAMFGGFYSVPLYALIQSRSEPSHRARIIAANNILNSLFMILSALLAIALTAAGVTIPGIFLTTALLNVAVAAYVYAREPEFLLRFVAWLFVHTVYRIRVVHAERIPAEGGAVLVCNRMSAVDAIVVMAGSPRPIRFVIDRRILRKPFAGWAFRRAGAIPFVSAVSAVSAREDAALVAAAYDECAAALANGQLVCLFPQGEPAATGDIDSFSREATGILQRAPVPVVPMTLHGPAKRLTLAIGEPLAPEAATPGELQRIVAGLHGAQR